MKSKKISSKEFISDRYRNFVDLFTEDKLSRKIYYNENKASYILVFFTGAFLFAFFFALFISLCFFNNSTPMHGHLINTGFQLVAAILFFGIVFVLYKILSAFWNLPRFKGSSFTVQLLVCFMILFTAQIILVINIYTTIGWDVFNMVHEATRSTYSAPIESFYLSMFPNNLLLFFILRNIIIFLDFLGLYNHWLWFAIINVVLVDIAILCTILTVRKLYPSFKRMYLLFILLSLLIGLSPWIIVLYSDTLLMPVVSLLVLL